MNLDRQPNNPPWFPSASPSASPGHSALSVMHWNLSPAQTAEVFHRHMNRPLNSQPKYPTDRWTTP